MPYSEKAKYRHHRQQHPSKFKEGSFKTVPLNHSKYKGKKFRRWNKKGTKAKAIVGKLKKSGKSGTQSILIPKKKD